MVRTHIYLTSTQQKGLRALSRRTGWTQSELLHKAVDSFLANDKASARADLLRQSRGLWAERRDLPDFGALRKSFDRLN